MKLSFTYLSFASLILFSVLLVSGPLLAEGKKDTKLGNQTAKTFKHTIDNTAHEMDYLLYVPQVSAREKKPLPLLIFLHGAGERGGDVEKVAKHGPPMLIKKGKDMPFIVISPQCAKGGWWGSGLYTKMLRGLIDQTIKEHAVDTSRIYITGLSMGGYGTWAMLAKYPDLFAAAIPICGGGNPKQAKQMVDVPIWVFHGEEDKVVKVEKSKEMVDAIKKAGGEKVKLTLYPKVRHNSWTRTYNNEAIFTWLLSHQKTDNNAP